MGVYALLINCCQLIYTGIVLVILKSLFWASWFDNGLNITIECILTFKWGALIIGGFVRFMCLI